MRLRNSATSLLMWLLLRIKQEISLVSEMRVQYLLKTLLFSVFYNIKRMLCWTLSIISDLLDIPNVSETGTTSVIGHKVDSR